MTKERLRNYTRLVRESRQIERKLHELDEQISNPPRAILTGTPSAPHGGNSGSVQERLADETMELREQLRTRYLTSIHDMAAEQLAIEEAIEGLDPQLRELMRARYLTGLTWEAICTRLYYSWRQVHRLHSRALEALKDEPA